MKTIASFMLGILIFLSSGCNSTIKEEKFKVYSNPTSITANRSELMTFYLNAENNSDELVSGNFNITLPKGIQFRYTSISDDPLENDTRSVVIKIDLIPHEKRIISMVVKVGQELDSGTKVIIKILAGSSISSNTIDISKTVIIK